MRVLLVANTLPPLDVSGVGEQVVQLADGLRQAGCEVAILGRGRGGVAGPKVLFPLFVVPALWRALRRFRPHVVQVHESDGGLGALLVAWLAPALEPRPLLVALLQVSYREELAAVRPLFGDGGDVGGAGGDGDAGDAGGASGRAHREPLGRPSAVEMRFRRFKAPLQIALGWLTARAADRVLAPSAATAGEIRRDYGVAEVAVVPNATGGALPVARRGGDGSGSGKEGKAGEEGGTDGEGRAGEKGGTDGEERAGEKDRGGEEREAGEAPGYLLVVGRLRIRKGVDVLLAALPAVLRCYPAARLLIAGDGEHRGALERAAGGLVPGGSVRFLGRCSAERVRGLLRGAAALVVPSVYEGMPLVVLEAMAASVPVVASRVSGIPEVVADGVTGWLVPAEDTAALAAALCDVLGDPAAARRRGAAGLRRVDEHFRPSHAARAWRQAVPGGPEGPEEPAGPDDGGEETRMVST